MLIHILPKLLVPSGLLEVPVSLIDLGVEELGLVLKGDQDLTVRRPYPNKRYWVGCKKIGQKAVAGLLIESEQFLNIYTVVTRWAINADTVLTHRVEHVVLDSEFDTVSDDMTLWYATCESLGSWSSRWPDCYKGMPPVNVEPRMDMLVGATGSRKREGDVSDVLSGTGMVVERVERFMVPTIERGRLLGKRAEMNRLPTMEHAFACGPSLVAHC